MSRVPNALVVSSNDELRKELADTLRHYGMRPLLASSVVQGLCVLSDHPINIVFCEDRLIDGDYLHFVDGVKRIAPRVPLVVLTQAFDINERAIALTSGVLEYAKVVPGGRHCGLGRGPGKISKLLLEEQHLVAKP